MTPAEAAFFAELAEMRYRVEQATIITSNLGILPLREPGANAPLTVCKRARIKIARWWARPARNHPATDAGYNESRTTDSMTSITASPALALSHPSSRSRD